MSQDQLSAGNEAFALSFYETRGDPNAALSELRRLWDSEDTSRSSNGAGGSVQDGKTTKKAKKGKGGRGTNVSAVGMRDEGTSGERTEMTNASTGNALIRRHNEAVLSHLSTTMNAFMGDVVRKGSQVQRRKIHSDDSDGSGIEENDYSEGLMGTLQSVVERLSQRMEGEIKDEDDGGGAGYNGKRPFDEANFMVAQYNLALSMLCAGDPLGGYSLLLPTFRAFFDYDDDGKGESDCAEGGIAYRWVDGVRCDVAFLLLDCIIRGREALPPSTAVSGGAPASRRGSSATRGSGGGGAHRGVGSDSKDHLQQQQRHAPESSESEKFGAVARVGADVDRILTWIGAYISRYERQMQEEAALEVEEGESRTEVTADARERREKIANELKFRTHMYRSRILFLRPNTVETQRQSKKEMKSAMEIFQHKLRRHHLPEQPLPPSSQTQSSHTSERVMTAESHALRLHDRYHGCALYLKADLEHLRGNAKKSLKLCAEARLAGIRHRGQLSQQAQQQLLQRGGFEDCVDEALHFNNLGIVHQTTGKVHIALHYYVKSLNLANKAESGYGRERTEETNDDVGVSDFTPDGYARPVPVCEILHNASLCALQAGKFLSSYECMAKCVGRSPRVFAKRPRCWLRMTEACLGLHSQQRGKSGSNCDFVVAGGMHGVRPRLVIQKSMNQASNIPGSLPSSSDSRDWREKPQPLPLPLGGADDLDETSRRPLLRSLFCAQEALCLCRNKKMAGDDDYDGSTFCGEREDCAEAALLALAFARLELRDPLAALSVANELIRLKVPALKAAAPGGAVGSDVSAQSKPIGFVTMQRRALARLYACEAYCLVGNPLAALQVLLDGDNEDFGTTTDRKGGDDDEAAIALSMEGSNEGGVRDDERLNELATELANMTSGADGGRGHEDKPSPDTGAAMPMTANAPRGKHFVQALSAVHVSASAAHASLGNNEAAERYALSAFNAKAPPSPALHGQTDASAKRALLRCLLRRGDTDGALSVLRSAR